MGITIKELVIKAHITEGNFQPVGSMDKSGSASTKSTIDEATKQQIISEAVRQIMDILERQKDR